jgi:Fe-S-cluster-containing dehydrogenase component
MAKVFVFDFKHCNGCYNCQISCKDEHCEQAWPPYSEAQPLTGQFWCKIGQNVRGQVPWVWVSYDLKMCNHCADAPCAKLGGEAVIRRDDGIILIDPIKAKGLKELVDSCPIGAIYYNEELDIPQKCTGCAHLLDNGWEVPRCVDACTTDALRYVDESELSSAELEIFEELQGFGPRFYMLNRPKRFIAGTVVDLEADEVVIGAAVELIDDSGVVAATFVTNDFGDFKFDQIAPAAYTVSVNGTVVAADVRERDLSLGDVAVSL